MRWDINGFVDNYGTACFDGNCGTIEPIEHDEGEMLSQATSSATWTEPPQLKQRMELLKEHPGVKEGSQDHFKEVQYDEGATSSQPIPSVTGIKTLEQRMDLLKLKDQDVENEMKPVQCMEELKEIDVDRTVPKVNSEGQSKVSLPTEHINYVQSVKERRANLKLNIMEKLWSMVEHLDQVPDVLNYIDRACLQITGIENGSLLFKVKVDTLDDLKRMQDLVRYGGMKKILDKELVEKNMEVTIGLLPKMINYLTVYVMYR